jgi:hypothetical protein
MLCIKLKMNKLDPNVQSEITQVLKGSLEKLMKERPENPLKSFAN